MYAVILAGGKGKRLSPLTDSVPKCLVEINGKAIIDYQIEWLRKYGFDKLILAIGDNQQKIINTLGSGSKYGVNITYSIEQNALGRGGAIRHAVSRISDRSIENFLVVNGDVITDFPITDLINIHDTSKALVTTLARQYEFPHDLIYLRDNSNVVKRISRVPIEPVWTNTGICMMNRNIITMLPQVGDYEIELLPSLAENGQLFAIRYHGVVNIIDTLFDLNRASIILSQRDEK